MIPAITGARSVVRSVTEGLAPSEATVAPSTSASSASTDFLSMLGQVANDGIQSLRESEATSIAGLQGKAPIQHVVDTLLTAERNLQTAVAVRDKLISAYQTVSQMPI